MPQYAQFDVETSVVISRKEYRIFKILIPTLIFVGIMCLFIMNNKPEQELPELKCFDYAIKFGEYNMFTYKEFSHANDFSITILGHCLLLVLNGMSFVVLIVYMANTTIKDFDGISNIYIAILALTLSVIFNYYLWMLHKQQVQNADIITFIDNIQSELKFLINIFGTYNNPRVQFYLALCKKTECFSNCSKFIEIYS